MRSFKIEEFFGEFILEFNMFIFERKIIDNTLKIFKNLRLKRMYNPHEYDRKDTMKLT